ncbi:MAG TPA: PsiF family protein [Steroidobacteraceae bacterium]|jgi:hypothetical protein|nr:PsiF family protein [Steroidobacteraceae bacterium]
MRGSTWLLGIGAALALLAGDAALAQNSQQEKMTRCNADAKTQGLSGDDRKAYMKTCLSAKGTSQAKGNSQQEKMKSCNADAGSKGLKGDDRKAFMKNCLSGPATG